MLDFQMIFGVDKLMHFTGFLGATVLAGFLLLIISGADNAKQQLKVIWFTLVTIGIIEEYRQFLILAEAQSFWTRWLILQV